MRLSPEKSQPANKAGQGNTHGCNCHEWGSLNRLISTREAFAAGFRRRSGLAARIQRFNTLPKKSHHWVWLFFGFVRFSLVGVACSASPSRSPACCWSPAHPFCVGQPGGTRTPYPCLRRTLLYPDELLAACADSNRVSLPGYCSPSAPSQ